MDLPESDAVTVVMSFCSRIHENAAISVHHAIAIGVGHGRMPPIKALAQKQGRFYALEYPY